MVPLRDHLVSTCSFHIQSGSTTVQFGMQPDQEKNPKRMMYILKLNFVLGWMSLTLKLLCSSGLGHYTHIQVKDAKDQEKYMFKNFLLFFFFKEVYIICAPTCCTVL